ncbi:MAG: hypothetical protein KGY39_00545 [Anaerolineales bacterium]|nr:hypothetical protein [Anaerolineales bacterium]
MPLNEKPFAAIVEICLERIKEGESVESCLSSFPEHAKRLAPLLNAASFSMDIKTPQPDPKAKSQGRERVIAASERLRKRSNSVTDETKSPLLRYARRMINSVRAYFVPKEKPNMKLTYRIAIYAVITMVLGSFFSVNASAESLPGDPLYSMKRSWENAQLALTLNENAREKLETQFNVKRINEIQALLSQGSAEKVEFTGSITEMSDPIWNIAGFPVRLGPDTEVEGEMEIGTVVNVEALTQEDGTLLAVEVEESSGEDMEDDSPQGPLPMEIDDDLDDDSDDDDMDDDPEDEMDDGYDDDDAGDDMDDDDADDDMDDDDDDDDMDDDDADDDMDDDDDDDDMDDDDDSDDMDDDDENDSDDEADDDDEDD